MSSFLWFFFICGTIANVKSELSVDGKLNFTQLADKYGLTCEEYDVVTEDKYILKLFHIKGDETKPILLANGIFCSADTFMIRGNISLVKALAEKKYDVWVPNVRGSKYGRRHETLDPDTDKAFWNFTYHEMGVIDLPTHIDYVLNKTNQPKLTIIGHSQGNQISLVLQSVKPEYNNKINLMIAFGPVACLNHMQYPTSTLPLTWQPVNVFLEATGTEELFNSNSFLVKMMQAVCSQKDIGYELCGRLGVFLYTGSDPPQLEPEFFPTLFGHFPTSSGRKQNDHLMQGAISKRFAQYDYGLGNLEKYGSLEPPEYPLHKITSPVALMVGRNDKIAGPKSVVFITDRLPNYYYHEMKNDKFTHNDFVWGKYMEDDLYSTVFELLKKHSHND